ncbi:MAG TPA: LuxR C-terminal-related transcriptional regulator [Oscillospiraceae bacterium]|nr:LuxR C-terminal-related transcriptional regulator [Oscillospiraceae bacterium]
MEKSNDVLLLSTKLKIPVPRRNYVVRKALFNKLSCCKDMGVIFVCGGAGTGKTTLLSSFILETGLKNVGWLSLDTTNSNVYSFWYYFAAATGAFLESDDDFLTLLSSNFDASHMKSLLTMLINRLCSEKDYYLVLDDVHCINDTALMQTLEFFIGAMPENLHLFMLSREDPPLYLGGLAVSGRLLFIDGRQMQLSSEEGMAFLKQTLKLHDSEEELIQINTYAEGWIGGLQLAAAAELAGKNSGALLRAGGGIAAEYLTREIFESLTQSERDFLVGTGFISYFDAELCGQLFDGFTQADFDEMIEKFNQKNLLIICIDEQNDIYRYHNILSEYLLQQFLHLPEKRKKELLTKSVAAFERRDNFEEALRELCMAGDYENAMRVVHTMGGSIEAWSYLDQIPFGLLIQDADLAAQCFLYNLGNLNIERCKVLYEKFRENYEGTDIFHVMQFAEAYVSKNRSVLPEYHSLTAQQIDALHFGRVAKAMILVQNAAALMERMQYDESEICIEHANKICAGANIFVEVFALNQKAQLYEETGRLNESLEFYAKSMELLKSPAMLNGIGINLYISLTGVYMRRMELDKAEESLQHSQQISEEQHVHIDVVDMTVTYHLAEMKFLRGEVDAGAAYVEEIISEYPYFNILTLGRLLHELDCEDMLKPALAAKVLQELESADDYRVQPFMKLLHCRLVFRRGETIDAMKETEEVLVFSRAHKNRLRLIEASLLKIFMLSQCPKLPEQQRQIYNLLREAVYYAYENRILMPFYLERRTVLPLLRELSAQDSGKNGLSPAEVAFVRDAIAICSRVSVAQKEPDILSARELDVLNELAQGITNREIAEKLCISQATVKTHVLNIFGKLDVSTRMLAVEEGRKRGLISDL